MESILAVCPDTSPLQLWHQEQSHSTVAYVFVPTLQLARELMRVNSFLAIFLQLPGPPSWPDFINEICLQQKTPTFLITENLQAIGICGADAYPSHLFSLQKLEHLLTHTAMLPEEPSENLTIQWGEEIVMLTPIESLLFHQLYMQRGHLVPRQTLVNLLSCGDGHRSLDVHISHLRKKLGAQAITTIRHRGYRLNLKEASK